MKKLSQVEKIKFNGDAIEEYEVSDVTETIITPESSIEVPDTSDTSYWCRPIEEILADEVRKHGMSAVASLKNKEKYRKYLISE